MHLAAQHQQTIWQRLSQRLDLRREPLEVSRHGQAIQPLPGRFLGMGEAPRI
jgi:hypothetical protein